MRTRDVMKQPVYVPSIASVYDAARLAERRRAAALIVVEEGAPVAVVSARRLARLRRRPKVGVLPVLAGAEPLLAGIEASASTSDAAERFSDDGLEQLLVYENGRVVGVLSRSDLFEADLPRRAPHQRAA